MDSDILFIFDIDNTILESYDLYDETCKEASKKLIGKEFAITRNVDGSKDKDFSKKTNMEIINERLKQLNIPIESIDLRKFAELFDKIGELNTKTVISNVYPNVKLFLKKLAENYELAILTSGTKKFQLAVLKNNNLAQYFNLKKSMFFGDYNSKKEAIELIANNLEYVVHFGDAPNDMKAIKEAKIKTKKIAIGITISKRVAKKELINAGADLVLDEYNNGNLLEVMKLIKK